MKKRFAVVTRGGVQLIPLESIIYLENDRRKIIVHTLDGTFEFYGRMNDAMNNLDDRFINCHRSFAINMEHVSEMCNQSITFCNNSRIFMGRDTFAETRRRVRNFNEENAKKSNENP